MAAATSGTEPSAAAAVASTDPDTQAVMEARNNCVTCGSVQPADGKLLRCLHVMCRKCLKESISLQGSVKCLQCPELLTTSRVVGVDLADQLMDCCPLLYGGSSNTTVGSTASETEKDRLNCNACEENEDLSREATHVCNDCNGLPLCDQHAGKHLKARFSSSHEVTDVNSSKALVAQPRHRCLLHWQFDVNLYCKTCKQTLCQKCLENLHSGHAIDSVSSAAKHQLDEFNDRNTRLSAVIWPSSPSPSNTKLSDTIIQISEHVSQLEEDGKAASKVITDTFDAVERLAQSAREHCLSEADRLVWKQLDPLLKQRKELRQLKQKEATIRCVAEQLSPDTDPLIVLNLLPNVVVNAAVLQKELERMQAVPVVHKITAFPKSGDGMKEIVESMISVSDSPAARLPLAIPVNVATTSVADSNNDGSTILRPARSGHILFNSQLATVGIKVEEFYSIAKQTTTDNRGCVFSLRVYSSGCWQWQLKVTMPVVLSVSGPTHYHISVGVSSDYKEDHLYATDRSHQMCSSFPFSYSWSSDGKALRLGSKVKPASMDAWRDGDVLTITLDIHRSRLTCTNKRTAQTKYLLLRDDDAETYVPIVLLPRPGMKVTYC